MPKTHIPDRLKLLFIPRDNKGCGFYRMMVPANEIKKQDLADVVVDFGWNWEAVNWAQIIIVQRATDPRYYEWFEQAQSTGKKIIYELDDLVQAINPESPAWDFWTPFGANLGRALKLIKKADAMQVTTERLRNEYVFYNKRIGILGNYLDSDLWDVPAWKASQWDSFYKKKNDNIIRIGWAGAASHRADLELIEEIITKICHKYPNVHFCLMGYHPEGLFQKISGAQSHCPTCGEAGQLEKIPGIELLYYPSKLRGCAFDIGVAPLVEIGFNQGKSDVKLKEYAALGIPVVATRMKPYSLSVREGYTGFLASTGKEWFDSLELLVKDKGLRERLGRNNYRWYKSNTIDKHINKWMDFYTKVSSFRYKW